MQITATVDRTLWAVKLTATGATGTVSWYRRTAGQSTPVGEGATAWDYTAPLNRSLEYIAVDDASTEVSPAVEIPAAAPVLSSTASPIAYQVRVVDYRPLEGEGRTVWHPVLGRPDPFVTIHDALYPSGLLRLHAPTGTERVALVQLLQRGEPLLLRSTCHDRVDTMTFIMLRWRDPFAGETAKHGPAYLEIEFQQVTETPGILGPDPDRTWQTVADDHATWQEVLQTYPTWRDVLDGAA